MVWGTLTRDPPSRYYIIILKNTHRAISIAVLMHYHRLLWSRLVGLITRSLTEELQTHGLYRTIMWRLTASVHIFRLTMDVIQSKKSNGCFFLFLSQLVIHCSAKFLLKNKLFLEKLYHHVWSCTMLVILLSCFVAVCHVIYSLQTLRVPILFHTVQPQLLCQLVSLDIVLGT